MHPKGATVAAGGVVGRQGSLMARSEDVGWGIRQCRGGGIAAGEEKVVAAAAPANRCSCAVGGARRGVGTGPQCRSRCVRQSRVSCAAASRSCAACAGAGSLPTVRSLTSTPTSRPCSRNRLGKCKTSCEELKWLWSDASQKRFSWFSDWIQKVQKLESQVLQKCANLVNFEHKLNHEPT